MDLSIYRLNTTKELADLAEKFGDRFGPFFDAVYRVLDNLKEGEKYDIVKNVHEENYDLFIKCACFYIIDKDRQRKTFDAWVEFSNDFRYIRKQPSCYPTVFHKNSKPPQSKTK